MSPSRLVRVVCLVAATALVPRVVARADEPAGRERFVIDRDAAALASRLASSNDPADRLWIPLARLAADPSARADTIGGGETSDASEATRLTAVVDALRLVDLPRARRAIDACRALVGERGASGTLSASVCAWMEALVLARSGRDAEAIRLVAEAPFDLRASRFALTVVGQALPRDDCELLAGVVRRAVIRAASLGRLDGLAPLAKGATHLVPSCAGRVVATAARALRRGARDDEASALLSCPEVARAGGVGAAESLALERAILAWRRGDAAAARAAAASVPTVPTGPTSQSFATLLPALARAAAAPSVVAGPPLALVEPDADADAAALARVLTLLGTPARADEIAARAAGRQTTCGDAQFAAETIASVGGASVEAAGDGAVAVDALSHGRPVVVRRICRRGDRFVESAVVARGVDPATGLVVLDEPNGDRVDVMPVAALGKARLLVVFPKARVAEAAHVRESAAGRLGAALSQDLAPMTKGDAASAGDALVVRASATGPAALSPAGRTVADLYAGWVQFAAAVALAKDAPDRHSRGAREEGLRAAAVAALRRSAATPPVVAVERYVPAVDGSFGRDEADAVAADLALVDRDDGPEAYIHAARFVILEGQRRHDDAKAAIAIAREIDPFDVLALYYRSGVRGVLGDKPGQKDDLVRVLDRRPDTLLAAEDLTAIYLDAGLPDKALQVVIDFSNADPKAARSPRARQLRQRTEIRIIRRARSAADLLPFVTSPEPDTRKEAAWSAASFETAEGEALLLRLLSDADAGVRRKAAQAFQRPWLTDRLVADAGRLAHLASMLASDAAPVVREALAISLARVENDASDAALCGGLAGPKKDADAAVRAAIAEALEGRDTPAVRRALVGALSDAESMVRTAAIRSLRHLAGASNGFEPDDPPEKRAAAVAAWEKWLATSK